jgi:hypothetical protein
MFLNINIYITYVVKYIIICNIFIMQSLLLEQLEKTIIEKNGVKIIKVSTNKFNLSFNIKNNNILLPAIVNFDLINLLNKVNANLFESTCLDKKSETNTIMNILLKDIFSDLGLPHYYLSLNINSEGLGSDTVIFNCLSFDNKLDEYEDNVELIPIYNIIIYFNIINNHNINFSCDINLNDHNIPLFFEKIIGNLFYNIFYRLKQFIENVSF